MENNEKVNWSARIVNATPAQLVLIIYELIFESIDEAIEHLKNKELTDFEKSLDKTRKLIMELTHDLKMQSAIEYDFLSLYLFVNKLLIQGYCRRDEQKLLEAKKILTTLYKGLCEAEKKVPREESVMKNAQQVYAGFTYGKGTLNETISIDSNRGFKA